jgi:hypothetical protein
MCASVDVAEIGVVIDTTTAQLQSNFAARQIVNLPIIENANGLFGALNLSLLSAGVTSNGGVGQGTNTFLEVGDVMETEVEGLGKMRNRFVAEAGV